MGKVIGKSCAGITMLQASACSKVMEQTLTSAQLKGRGSHPVLTSSAGKDAADSKFLEKTQANILLFRLHATWRT